MAGLNLSQSEDYRSGLTRAQEGQIRAMYGRLAKETQQKADALAGREDSSVVKRQMLEDLSQQLKDAQSDISRTLEQQIPMNMRTTAQAVVEDNLNWLNKEGMSIRGAYTHVSQDVVNAVISGRVYGKLPDGSNWTLSKAIWNDDAKIKREIDRIIAEGIAANKSTFEIAKDLEKYVDPSAAKPWDWGKVYPGTRKQIDYNAQRLARTLVSHAYQAAFVATTRPNPFVSGYIWHISESHRVCPICEELDGQFFEKDTLPLDHPNGMCFYEAVIPDLESVADRIADWYDGKPDTDLDMFARYLYGNNSGVAQDAANMRQTGDVTKNR